MTEVRTTSETGGEKGVKPERYDLIPAWPLEEVARLYGWGASKYDDRNWERGYKWSNSFAALMRHCWAFWRGEEKDPESGLSHLAHAVFHLFALMDFARVHRQYDDRSTIERKLLAKQLPRDHPGVSEAVEVALSRYDPRSGTYLGGSGGNADGPDR